MSDGLMLGAFKSREMKKISEKEEKFQERGWIKVESLTVTPTQKPKSTDDKTSVKGKEKK